jgi:hypothetical protein
MFGADVVSEAFLPMALRYLATAAAAVKYAAADGVIAFFRCAEGAGGIGPLGGREWQREALNYSDEILPTAP